MAQLCLRAYDRQKLRIVSGSASRLKRDYEAHNMDCTGAHLTDWRDNENATNCTDYTGFHKALLAHVIRGIVALMVWLFS